MPPGTHVELERTFDLPVPVDLPELSEVAGVARVERLADEELDATYFDTDGFHLARARTTLRRRTGGRDAGWHLKLPAAGDAREEVSLPARGRATAVPAPLRALVRSRTHGVRLRPVARLHNVRRVHQLLDDAGTVLAEVAEDDVRAEVLVDPGAIAAWQEVEVELVEGDAALLDEVSRHLEAAGAVPAALPSKLLRTLGDRVTPPARPALPSRPTAADAVLLHLHEQVEELRARDPDVRRDLPDAVHRMRVATRRLRSALRTCRPLLDREVTDPLRAELAHLAGALGQARDAEVLRDRLRAAAQALPPELVLGPVLARIEDEVGGRYRASHDRVVAELDGERYLALLDALDALLADPPWLDRARRPARKQLRRLVRRVWRHLEDAAAAAEAADTPQARDALLHEVRKRAKQLRYAAEAAVPVLGETSAAFGKRAKAVQDALGEHQDSVVARQLLRELGVAAHLTSGENGFTFGLLHGLESGRAERDRERFDDAWRALSARRSTRWLA